VETRVPGMATQVAAVVGAIGGAVHREQNLPASVPEDRAALVRALSGQSVGASASALLRMRRPGTGRREPCRSGRARVGRPAVVWFGATTALWARGDGRRAAGRRKNYRLTNTHFGRTAGARRRGTRRARITVTGEGRCSSSVCSAGHFVVAVALAGVVVGVVGLTVVVLRNRPPPEKGAAQKNVE